MPKTIIITSGKGGVGKTSISVNTAIRLAQKGYRTCLIDADLGLANVNILLGIQPSKNIDDFLFHNVPLEEIIVKYEEGLDIIPGSSGVEEMANLDADQLTTVMNGFSVLSCYDYCLIDTSSGISKSVISFCLASTETLVILTSESTSLTDAYALLKVLSINKYQGVAKILVNKCDSIEQAKRTYLHFKNVADKHLKIDIKPGGAVLRDMLIEKAVSSQQPLITLFPDSIAAQCIRTVTLNLARQNINKPSQESENFWSRYKEILLSDLNIPDKKKKTNLQETVQTEEKTFPFQARKKRVESPEIHKNDHLSVAGLSTMPHGLLNSCDILTPAPILGSMLEKFQQNKLSTPELQEIIQYEPALLCQIFHVYSLSHNLKNKRTWKLSELFKELGEENIRSIILTFTTKGLLGNWTTEQFTNVNKLWEYSCKCAEVCRELAKRIQYPYQEEAFLAGLLHDTGRLLMVSSTPEIYGKYFTNISSHNPDLIKKELELFGKNHWELGAEILSSWGANQFIVDATKYHGESEKIIATALDTTKLLYLARQLCTSDADNIAHVMQLASDYFGLTRSQVHACYTTAEYSIKKLIEKFNFSLPTEHNTDVINSQLKSLRDQAIEFLTIQSIFQNSTTGNVCNENCTQAIQYGMSTLYGINRVICLFPDEQERQLKASNSLKPCYDNNKQDISFNITSKTSTITQYYLKDKAGIILENDCQTLADKQLLHFMESDAILCLPLSTPKTKTGLIVCGLKTEELHYYQAIISKLLNFSNHAAQAITSSNL